MSDELMELEGLKERAAALKAEQDRVQESIKHGFRDVAVVFLDVVGSTEFKLRYSDEPWVWIMRVRQFSRLLATAITAANGRVVKYIGDEVMAVFDDPHDAANLVTRVEQIEAKLHVATGYETRIKVAADYGPVYFLEFDGHVEPDPQGTTVDRCARIAKFCVAGEVLAGREFAMKTPKLGWQKLGKVQMKGLKEPHAVFQLGRKTVDLEPRMEVKVKDWEKLKDAREELEERVATLEEKNAGLVKKLREAGKQPTAEDLASSDASETFTLLVEAALKALRPLPRYVKEALFLETRGDEVIPDEDDEVDAKRADQERYADFDTEDGTFSLRDSHPKVRAAKQALDALGKWLEEPPEDFELWYGAKYSQEPDLRGRPFWRTHLAL